MNGSDKNFDLINANFDLIKAQKIWNNIIYLKKFAFLTLIIGL